MSHLNGTKFMQISKMIAAFLVIGIASIWTCKAQQSAAHQVVDFLPINISLSCQPDTPTVYRSNYSRAAISNPGVDPVECVDRRNSIDSIYPEKVEMVYRRDFESWSIVFFIREKDLPKVQKLSEKWVGKKILVGINNKIIAYAILNGPLNEQKVYISVDSEKLGDDLLTLFVASQ